MWAYQTTLYILLIAYCHAAILAIADLIHNRVGAFPRHYVCSTFLYRTQGGIELTSLDTGVEAGGERDIKGYIWQVFLYVLHFSRPRVFYYMCLLIVNYVIAIR